MDPAADFTARLDQAKAGLGDLADMLGGYYRGLVVTSGVPSEIAGTMTLDLQQYLLSRDDDEE